MTKDKLKKLIAEIPNQPGVYFFLDENKEKIYIGKAGNLKSRLNSYLKTSDTRIKRMVEKSSGVSFIPAHSDIEALILESKHIKAHRPMFNIVMRDDKQYFFVGFTRSNSSGQAKEKYSRIFLTHQPLKGKIKSDYIGPFTDGNALKTTLRFLRKIFPYCTCKQLHNVPCLNYHIGKCLGFCCLKNQETHLEGWDKHAYQKNISAIKDVLKGKKGSLVRRLEREMKATGKTENFEKAIELRNQIDKLRRIFENARVLKEHENLDNHAEPAVLKDLQKAFKLPYVPHRIEGYDISNIQGSHATGAMVVFTHAQADKNQYRKFKIRYTPAISNDTAMLKEVLDRRLKHEEWGFPDLILVDGGKGQLNVVMKAIRYLPRKLVIVALTKNEKHRGDHVYVSGQKECYYLKDLPKHVTNLLLSIDAEAHRFAINFYRQKHRKSSLGRI